MDRGHGKARMNVEDDRLSMLPDDLIHKIFSFISTKHVIQTSALSSRWRFIWTSMPYLNISIHDFSNSEFVNQFLSHRNTQVEVYSVELSFHQTFRVALLKRILDYAFSHNVQQLTVTCLRNKNIDFPLYLFCSPSLKYLRLTGCDISLFDPGSIILASTLELAALTTLHLDYVAFNDDDLFSKCANLKHLTLNNFTTLNSINFTLCHPGISNLTLKDECWTLRDINVVAPQLKNLTIRSHFGEDLITITAPNLASLFFRGSRLLQFSTDLPSLEMVDLCISSTDMWSGCRTADLLQRLHNVNFLTLNLEFIEPLISYMEGISLQPSPFSNLKSLRVYPHDVPLDDEAHEKVNMSPKVLNYLLDGSPSATFTLISYEEIKEKRLKARAMADAFEAQMLMEDLQVILKKEKANIETNRTRMRRVESHEENGTNEEENVTDDEGKAPVEKMQVHFKTKMAEMKRCWADLGVRIDQGKSTHFIISQLRDIEVLLHKDLPSSKRDELQARFSSLCAEVDAFMKKILHQMMIPQMQLSDCFNELATTSLPSSKQFVTQSAGLTEDCIQRTGLFSSCCLNWVVVSKFDFAQDWRTFGSRLKLLFRFWC